MTSIKIELKNKLLFILLLFSLFGICYSVEFNPDEVWENSTRKIRFDLNDNCAYIRLKTFYGLWLDTEYRIDFDFQKRQPLVHEDFLFVRYWKESHFVKNYYLPCSNSSEITLDEQVTDENVYGYYFSESSVYAVRYWKCSSDVFDDEKKIELNTEENKVFIPKYLQIADDYYTCIQGRGEKLRRLQKIERSSFENAYPEFQFFTQGENSYLVLQKHYLVKKSKID